MRRILFILSVMAVSAGAWVAATASADDTHTYRVELDNAFGLVNGSDVKVAGVQAGSIKSLGINAAKRAVVTIEVSGPFSDLREDATCSSEPQSLIAEYFLDCQPGHSDVQLKPNPACNTTSSTDSSDGCVTVEHTTTTVANDLVNNTLRQPFKQRLQLIINEFGTALAGNPENLNEAIRRGAPALRSLRKALEILGKQNKLIANLNVDSDEIIGKLAENRANVQRFIHNANATAATTAAVRTQLGENFHLLPQFLAELQPTLAELGKVADEQAPLLADLRASAPQLNQLVVLLPQFNKATKPALLSLGDASDVGYEAVTQGKEEIKQLNEASKPFPNLTKNLADFLDALGDPRYAVEEDTRATTDNCSATPAGQLPAQVMNYQNPTSATHTPPTAPPQCPIFSAPGAGYNGVEGLLNYVYYQTTAINQFDQVGHLLHFILYEVGTSPCFNFNNGRSAAGQASVPTTGGPLAADLSNLHRCVSWLGDYQPDICRNVDSNADPNGGPGDCTRGNALTPYGPGSNVGTPGQAVIGPYGGSICPAGSNNPALCQPGNPDPLSRRTSKRSAPANDQAAPQGPLSGLPNLPGITQRLGDILGLPQNGLRGLGGKVPRLGLRQRRALQRRQQQQQQQQQQPSPASDLLNFLLGA